MKAAIDYLQKQAAGLWTASYSSLTSGVKPWLRVLYVIELIPKGIKLIRETTILFSLLMQ